MKNLAQANEHRHYASKFGWLDCRSDPGCSHMVWLTGGMKGTHNRYGLAGWIQEAAPNKLRLPEG